MGLLQTIIAKGLAIVDELLSTWATAAEGPGVGMCDYNIMVAGTTSCGDELVVGLAELVHRGVDLLNGMVQALGAVGM